MEVMELGANVISIDAIRENRAAGRGKNWTNAELARRTQEAEKLKSGQLKMKMPEWLKADKKDRARAIWTQTLNSVRDIELFANCDSEILATYCDICVQYEDATMRTMPYAKDIDRLGKLKMTYAEKLGLTPTSRARLVVSRAKDDGKKTDRKAELFG